ncbi:flagellar biosynthetic protein FliR [Criibacterium bergeronii]|uniref:Flagellar biosynthetic protein FliR n=1 Tax=Criibacterium bergeronii TaxID=1871336 RepID=A0A371IMJ4_9FIRM|nr:flagellar biosynthetic protein FliR [Criibacterium bergeronii]MBS6062377.1 flagellar biosynthetic protein FliR [Peptostreptococcaceae bacterium]RDY21725.1 flagellar biosynthetic protein FliR [Criibacterium bergeronii]TRW28633.1 flagellar biosynthetic protein FliR [Criibacterium bergeronii]
MTVDVVTFVMRSLDVYLLIFSRIIGIMTTVPVFSRNNIPAPLKVGLSMIISYIILPFIIQKTNLQVGTAEFLFLCMKEVLLGFFIGLCAQMVFNVFVGAGSNADIQIGLSMANVIDPSTGANNTLTGLLFNTFAYLLLFAADAHHLIIRAIVNSFNMVPVGQSQIYSQNLLPYIAKLVSYFMVASLLIVMPIIITLFLGNILLAFMAKVMPQMNVFIVGMPFKILVGFSIIYFTMPFIKTLIFGVFEQMIEFVYMFLRIV